MDHLMDQYLEHERDPKFLYQGSQESIIKELHAWIVRRKEVYREQMEVRDLSQKATKATMNDPVIVQEPGYFSTILGRKNRATTLDNEANLDSARAAFLLDTLKSRGFTWPDLWWEPDIDGGVCSFLGTVDDAFDARATLTILEAKEEKERLTANRAELDPQIQTKWAAVEAKYGRPLGQEAIMAMAAEMAGQGNGAGGGGPIPTGRGQPGGGSHGSSSGGGDAWFHGKPAVVSRAEEKLKVALALALDKGLFTQGDQKNPSRQEKRAEARKEAKAKAKEDK
ncbi:MAG: hypothetical protein ASARMPRED_005821 [Alectoria sarmentosa]|nr:MAG: hypothetical protein ASARMPRED_005821 [Alectoria sarmentosa]